MRFEGAELPIDVRAFHTTDLDGCSEDDKSPQVQEVLRALRAILAREHEPRPVTAPSKLMSPAAAVPTGDRIRPEAAGRLATDPL